jgi:hypothetical protein
MSAVSASLCQVDLSLPCRWNGDMKTIEGEWREKLDSVEIIPIQEKRCHFILSKKGLVCTETPSINSIPVMQEKTTIFVR